MDAKETRRGKSAGHRSAPCHDPVAPTSSTGVEDDSLKSFTIPKLKTSEKVYLSSCPTNQREYSSISHTLAQCRLDLNCELQAAWQFGETKLVHNEYLEQRFSAKRTEMRERGRRSRELEENYCFLALPHNAVAQMYQSGLCTQDSTMKALGNPQLGVYLFKHSDVALNYARSRKHPVDSLMIFRVLYGKVKKVQPVVDRNKASLDPSPHYDCHMSRLVPTPKDTIEQQAHSSAVYLYEYNTLSKPVDKPRQCLPYATVTVRFLGQKAESGPTITSMRFLSAGFSKWPADQRGSLNNCTIAKRIGKGKDATVIYEHFPKSADLSAQDSCCCAAEMNTLATNGSSPHGNAQNSNFFTLGPIDGQTEHNLAEGHNPSQVQTTEASLPLPPSGDATQSVNGDLLINFNYLEKFLTTLSAAVALPNSVGASTVTTSKLIKDPRLLKRGGSHDQANPEACSGETLPLESREESPDSEVKPSPSLPADAALPSGAAPPEPPVLHQGSPCPGGTFCQNCDYGATHKAATDDAKEGQPHHDLQVPLPECKNQECSDKKMRSLSQTNRILLPIKKQARGKYISERSHFPGKGMPMDTSPERLRNHKTWKLQPADFKSVRERLRPPSPETLWVQPETRDKFIQDTQNMKNLNADTKNHSKGGKNKYSKKNDSYDSTQGERQSLRDFYPPHKKHKTLVLSHQDNEACKQPQSQGPALQMLPSLSPPEQEEKSNSEHKPRKSENSYPPAVAQKSSKSCLEEWLRCERMYIDKYFSKSPEVTELKTGSLHQIPIGTKVDAPQDVDNNIGQTKEKPNDLINLSLDAKVPHFKVIRDENVHGGNEKEPVSPAGPHKNGRLNACLVEEVDRSQDCPVFCDPVFADDDASFPDLNIYFQEQEFRSEESNGLHPEREERQSPFVEKNRMENIYVDEKQVVYMNKSCTTIVSDKREIKNLGRSAVMYSEGVSSTFNLASKKSYVSIETALVENENRVTPGNQGGTLLGSKRKLMPQVATLSEATGSCKSHIHKDSGTSVPFPAAWMPESSTGYEDYQGEFLGLAQAVQSPSFGACGRNVFGEHRDDMGHIRSNEGCELHTISKDPELLFPQDLAFDNEIEIEFEQREESLLQQDTAVHGSVSADGMNSVYQLLESRIDWENLFGSRSWKPSEGSKSCSPQEDGSQCFLRESSCIYSCTQKNYRELFCPVVVPDLQIQITNIIQSEITLSQEPVAVQDEVLMCATPEIAEVEMTDVWQESEPVASPSQFTCENIDRPEEELSLMVQSEASELRRNLVLSPPPDSSVHKATENPQALSPQPAATSQTAKDQSTCPLAKPRDAHNRTPRVKDEEPKSSKGKVPASLKNKIVPSRNFRSPEPCDLTRKTNHHQSSEQFSSLSEGRIKTFSQSERHIRSVLNALYSEASLCKSKRLSRKLDRAVLHLKKAHRRVHRSLKLITKVGEKRRNSPLPRSYEVIRNSLWECCDLEGYNFLTERRYYSRHNWQKRKDERREEKRTSGLEVVRSRTLASHHQGCGSNSRDRGAQRSLSIEGLSSATSLSHTSTLRSSNPDRPRQYSSRGSALNRGSWKDPRRADCKVPNEQSKAFPSHHSDRERSLDFIFLSSIHTEERSKKPSGDLTSGEAPSQPHSAPSRMERNVKFSNGLGEKSLPLDPNKPDIEGDGETHSRGNSDLFVSVLKSSTEHFFNVDTSEMDHLKLPGDPPKLEDHLPAEKSLTASVSSKVSSGSEHLVGGSGSTAPWTSQEGENGLQNFSCIFVKNNAAEQWTPHSEKLSEGLPTGGGLTTQVLSLRQEQPPLPNDGEDALDTIQGPCKNSPQRGDRKEGSCSESVLAGPAPLEKNKICKKNVVDVLPLNISLENSRSSSSQKSAVKEKDKKRQTKPAKREQQPEKPVEESSVLPGPSKTFIQMEGQDKQGQALDSSSVAAVSWSRVTPSLLARTKEEEGRMEAEHEPALSPSAPPATTMDDPAPRRKKVPQTCDMYVHPGMPEAGPAQQLLPTRESKEDQSSEDLTRLSVELSRILHKEHKASTLKSLQEQIKTCQNVLPLFIEPFGRKQKCFFKHVLISRNLLVEGSGWSSCQQHLHPQAMDSLVELQMRMETMQFIENKKGLMGHEPTFRSSLWCDTSLYGELLRGNPGYQQQSCLYPAFQDRLKYNAFSELQHYHSQLTKLLEEARKDNKSYYTVLKYKWQIEECEDIMKRCSNYFDFTLSTPFTCGVNFGDDLEDLETLRKSPLELISNQDHFPKIQSCPGKQDHLWIIMEMISSKMHFIKNSETVSMKVSLYGLEHIFFDAAKSLVWKEGGLSVGKNDSPEKMKDELLIFNQCAFKKLQQIYETLEADGKAERASKGWLEETAGNAPNMCCVGEILDQAESADLKQLEELAVRCRGHLETLKKCFQILQEASADSVLITEDNVLDVANKPSHQVVLLKPEAVEMYVEVVMLAETIHFLKNIMAKKLDQPRFRGMLWFDLSLLPELIENQEKRASFSFLKENAATCLWEAVEAVILELKGDATVICEYPEGANSSYALQLLSRELAELSEIRALLEQATPPITTYVDLVPYTTTVNYGTTLSELEYNYNQFAMLLKNLTLASQKDLGKIAHVMKVMRTIEHLTVSCATTGSCDDSLLTFQMFSNAEKAHQHGKEETRVIPKMKSRKWRPSQSESLSPSIPLKDPVVSKKRPFLRERSQECPDPPSCKKPKMGDLLLTDVKKTREPKGPLQDGREKTADGEAPLSQTRKWSPDVPRQGSPGWSCLPLQQGLLKDSPPTAKGIAGQQGTPAGMAGRGRRKRSWSEGTLPGAPGLPPQTTALQAMPFSARASFHSEANLHSAAMAEDLGFVCTDGEMLLDGTDGIQPLSTIPPGHVAVVLQPVCSGPTAPHKPGPRAEPPNQGAPGSQVAGPFSQQQQQPEDVPRVFVPASGGCWNGQPPRTPQGSQACTNPLYPYSSRIYHYCSSDGNSVTQTYQEIVSHEGQPLPTAAAVAPIYHMPANLLGCSGLKDPPRSSLGQPLPSGQGLSFRASRGPLPCPTTACAASQTSPQAPCPPRPAMFPGASCLCAPWQQGSLQNEH